MTVSNILLLLGVRENGRISLTLFFFFFAVLFQLVNAINVAIF